MANSTSKSEIKFEVGKTYRDGFGCRWEVQGIDDTCYPVCCKSLDTGDLEDFSLTGLKCMYDHPGHDPYALRLPAIEDEPKFEVGNTYVDGTGEMVEITEIHRVSLRVQIYERLHQINKALGELYQLVGTADWKDDE